MSDRFAEAVIQCGFPGKPDERISIDTMDAVVNGKLKKGEGKGYYAFLRTTMLFNLMKLLEESGTYAHRLLFLDSPILSLKEKKIRHRGKRGSTVQYAGITFRVHD